MDGLVYDRRVIETIRTASQKAFGQKVDEPKRPQEIQIDGLCSQARPLRARNDSLLSKIGIPGKSRVEIIQI